MNFRILTASVALAAIAVATPLKAANEDRPLETAFREPLRSDRPDVRWWWPGGAVDDGELERQIDLIEQAGFGGAEIQPMNLGLVTNTPDEKAAVNSYGDATFFQRVGAAAVAAKKHGLALDYTFGSAWPSGGGFAITPEKAMVELTMAATTISDGAVTPIKVAIPARTSRLGAFSPRDNRWDVPEAADWPARMDARAKIVAVIALRGDAPELAPSVGMAGLKLSAWDDVLKSGKLDPSTTVNLTDKLKPDGTLDWVPPSGKWQILVFKQYAVNSSLTGSVGKGPQLVLDHLNSSAFAAHVGRVGDPMIKAVGTAKSSLRATFVDSLELMQDLPWTENFLTAFKARRGYDLTPYLPFVIQPGWMQAWGERYSPPYYQTTGMNMIGERARADYRQTVSDLMIEGFAQPLVAWSHKQGLQVKFQAHGGPWDLIRAYGIVDIPETENLGADYDALSMRFARSAANIYGRKLVSAEALASGSHPYDRTPAWMRGRIDMFFAAGVNAQTFHGYAYNPVSVKWPGWYPFAPTAYNSGFGTMFEPSNPVWDALPTLNSYIARTNAVLRQGKPIVPVALYYGEMGEYKGIEDKGAHSLVHEKALIAGGYDYDRINAEGLLNARVKGKQIVTAGGHRYSAIVLPAIDALRAEVAEKIAIFAKSGVTVLFTGAFPTREMGLLDADERDQQVRVAMTATIRSGGRLVAPQDMAGTLRAASIDANLQFKGNARDLVFVERKVGQRRVFFVYNSSSEPRDASFAVPSIGGVERWDALNGTIAVQAAKADGRTTLVDLPLSGHGSALLVVDPRKRPSATDAEPEFVALTLPQQGWRLTLSGHGTGATRIEREIPEAALGEYARMPDLASFCGKATYSRVIEVPALTRGQRIWIDLGTVHDAAIVTVNGHRLPALIDAPWRQEITSHLRPGANQISIMVMNTPQNAMRDPNLPGFKALSPEPAGLHGPATLHVEK